MTRIAFLILTWNSSHCIDACLNSIFSLDPDILEGKVIVVDNGSSDGSPELVEQLFADRPSSCSFACELIRLEKNLGTTASRNIGLRRLVKDADIDLVCVLDSDTAINTDAILTLASVLAEDPLCAIAGPRMRDRSGKLQTTGRSLPTLTEKVLKVLPCKALSSLGTAMERAIPPEGHGSVPVGYLLSACWLMPRTLFAETGLLDEGIFYAPEDVEFCLRCRVAGYSIRYCYDAEILHEWQRLSRKKLFSRHNFEHIKGLARLFRRYGYLFSTQKLEARCASAQAKRRSGLRP